MDISNIHYEHIMYLHPSGEYTLVNKLNFQKSESKVSLHKDDDSIFL